MQITLMRHGKPVLPAAQWVAPFEMGLWIEQYDRSEVAATAIAVANMDAATAASTIVSSTAPRALSSVAALGHRPSYADALFGEAELPFALWRFPHLPPQIWTALFRLLWLCGYARGAASVQQTKIRAKLAARHLIALADTGPVLLVGHGIMNRMIAKELLASGWVSRSGHANRYWSTGVYRIAE